MTWSIPFYRLLAQERAAQFRREAHSDRLVREASVARSRGRAHRPQGGDARIEAHRMRRGLVAALVGFAAASAFRARR